MDFEMETWDVSLEASELNKSLFNDTAVWSNKKKKKQRIIEAKGKDVPPQKQNEVKQLTKNEKSHISPGVKNNAAEVPVQKSNRNKYKCFAQTISPQGKGTGPENNKIGSEEVIYNDKKTETNHEDGMDGPSPSKKKKKSMKRQLGLSSNDKLKDEHEDGEGGPSPNKKKKKSNKIKLGLLSDGKHEDDSNDPSPNKKKKKSKKLGLDLLSDEKLQDEHKDTVDGPSPNKKKKKSKKMELGLLSGDKLNDKNNGNIEIKSKDTQFGSSLVDTKNNNGDDSNGKKKKMKNKKNNLKLHEALTMDTHEHVKVIGEQEPSFDNKIKSAKKVSHQSDSVKSLTDSLIDNSSTGGEKKKKRRRKRKQKDGTDGEHTEHSADKGVQNHIQSKPNETKQQGTHKAAIHGTGKPHQSTNSLPFNHQKISKILAKHQESLNKNNEKVVAKTKTKDMQSTNLSVKQKKKLKHKNHSSDSDGSASDADEPKLSKNSKKLITEVKSGSGQTAQKSLLQLNRERLEGARFRFINEQLYVRTGAEAFNLFKDDPEAFHVYHKGFQNQVEKWPVNPLDVIIDYVKSQSEKKIVADFGCGDAKLAQSVPHRVHSFDLVALNDYITVCDVSKVPLPDDSVDIAIFCLSLMGTNFSSYLTEANRVLKKRGTLVIAEVASRFGKRNEFIQNVKSLGFKSIDQDTENSMFVLMKFEKTLDIKNKVIRKMKLKPCVYKKR